MLKVRDRGLREAKWGWGGATLDCLGKVEHIGEC